MIKYSVKEKTLNEIKKKYDGMQWIEDAINNDELYRKNKDKIHYELRKQFDLICKKCIDMQNNNAKGEIEYIYFSMLRTSLIEGRGEYRIDFYDDNWYLDKAECSTDISLDFIYKSLFSLKEKLINEYCSDITVDDIDNFILDEADKYIILCVDFLKEIVTKQFITLPSYKEMKKKDDIKISAGEFMDKSVIIYESEKEKLNEEL